LIVAVVGSGTESPEMLDMAERVGRDLARRGVKLVCGGGGGVMEAACRGAKSAAGLTIGILSSGDRSSANPWVDIPVPTGFSQGRNVLVVKTGDAVIAIGGRYGTLSEIGHALKAGIPVIGLNTWQLSRDDQPVPAITVAADAADAVDKAVEAARAAGAV